MNAKDFLCGPIPAGQSSTNLSNLSGAYLQAADIDNDGSVLATDALKVLKYSTKSFNIEIN